MQHELSKICSSTSWVPAGISLTKGLRVCAGVKLEEGRQMGDTLGERNGVNKGLG